MYLEINEDKQLLDVEDWFKITSADGNSPIGYGAYAKVIDVDTIIQRAVIKAIAAERDRCIDCRSRGRPLLPNRFITVCREACCPSERSLFAG